MKKIIAERTVIARINKHLKSKNRELRKYQPSSLFANSGQFYIVDLEANILVDQFSGGRLESMAIELDCIEPEEYVKEFEERKSVLKRMSER